MRVSPHEIAIDSLRPKPDLPEHVLMSRVDAAHFLAEFTEHDFGEDVDRYCRWIAENAPSERDLDALYDKLRRRRSKKTSLGS